MTSSLIAFGAMFLLLLGLTLVPYLLDKGFSAPSNPPASSTAAGTQGNSPTPAAATPDASSSNSSVAAKSPADNTTETLKVQPKKKDILDVLGETGSKKANPKLNPLDKKEDDLLKDLK